MTVVLDSSALAAVVLGEVDAEHFRDLMQRHAGEFSMSAATHVEVGIVVEARQGPEATADLVTLLDRLAVTIESLDAEQADLALIAWRRFGKGRHPAGLNLGDCYAYATAATPTRRPRRATHH